MTDGKSDGKSDGNITRCPHCDTSFRVTDTQLEAARGAVRCGSCLLVFSALEHLVLPKSESELEPVWPDEESDDVGIETIVERDDFTDVSPIMMPFGSLVPRENTGFVPQEPDDAGQETAGEEDAGTDDEREDTGVTAPALAESAEVGLIDTESDADNIEEDWHPEEMTPVDLDQESAISESAATDDFDGELDDDTPSINIDDDEVDIHESAPAMQIAWRWWGAAALLVGLLGVQFLWFERETLSLDPRYRDTYLGVCRFLPCALPEYAEPDALGISSLIIRSHPTRAGALRADALMKNDAQWRQAFPDLRLQFSNLQNAPVAGRVFRPDEYLAGEMAGLRFIPAQTEVRVTLEIMDPGPDAVNYSLEIL